MIVIKTKLQKLKIRLATIYGYYTKVHSRLGIQKDCLAPKSLSKHYFE